MDIKISNLVYVCQINLPKGHRIRPRIVWLCGFWLYVGDSDKRRSLTGYVFLYGPNLINLEANVQSIIALSTTEAECITLYETVKEGLWLKRLMKDFWIKYQQPKYHSPIQKPTIPQHNKTHRYKILFHSRKNWSRRNRTSKGSYLWKSCWHAHQARFKVEAPEKGWRKNVRRLEGPLKLLQVGLNVEICRNLILTTLVFSFLLIFLSL